MNETIRLLNERTSVRAYTDEPVSDADRETVRRLVALLEGGGQ